MERQSMKRLKTERIAIVGSGLVGSLLAVHLARRGHRVEVLERSADPRTRRTGGRSINLTLCERGWQALRRLDAAEKVLPLAVPAYGRMIHDRLGRTTFQPYGNRREAIWSIPRRELNKALLSFAEAEPGVSLHFGKECVGVEQDAPCLRVLDRVSGVSNELRPDRVFGADGAYSEVRARLQLLDRYEYSQHYIEQGYKEFDVPRGSDLDPHALHIWPRGRRMLIGFANPDGSFTLALHMPFDGERSYASIKTRADLHALFDELFPDARALLPRLAENYFSRPAVSMVTVRCSPWIHDDKVALIGDAAHAMVPSYGQGANCGFEDCSVLVDCLDAARSNEGEDWSRALPEYQARRKIHADAIAELALEHFAELQEHLADPVFLLRKRIERRVEELFPEEYVSLYGLITFTGTPYAEARRRAAGNAARIDQLLALPDPERQLAEGAMDAEIRLLFEPRSSPARRAPPGGGQIRGMQGRGPGSRFAPVPGSPPSTDR